MEATMMPRWDAAVHVWAPKELAGTYPYEVGGARGATAPPVALAAAMASVTWLTGLP